VSEDFIEKVTKQYSIEAIIKSHKGRPKKDGKEKK
jgi:hypothetical protein